MICLQNCSYSIDVARALGVHASIFLTCIDMEYEYQKRNNKLSGNDALSLSRAEIEARTALGDDEQKEVEFALQKCGVLIMKPLQNIPNKNYYIVNFEQIDKILDDPNTAVESEIANQFIRGKRKEPLSKRQTHINAMKKCIRVESPVLQQLFVEWVDAVYTNPKGFLSKSSVEMAQQELLEYAKDNEIVQVKVMREAIKGGFRDITWAIQNYEKNNDVKSDSFASYNDKKPVSLSTEVF